MKNPTPIVAIISLLLILLISGFIFWPTLYRYEKIDEFGTNVLYRFNRISGKAEKFQLGNWIGEKNNEEVKTIPLEIIPADEQAKITGKANIDFLSHFKAEMYNGSNWTIKNAKLKIRLKENNGDIRWEREFICDIECKSMPWIHFQEIPPSQIGIFSAAIIDAENIGSFEWWFTELKGNRVGRIN